MLALPQLMMLLQRPLSNRCAAGATWLIFCYAANSEAEANCELGAKLLQLMAGYQLHTESQIPCATLVQLTQWLQQLLHAEQTVGPARELLRDPAAVCQLLRVATVAAMAELDQEMLADRFSKTSIVA